MNTVAHQRFLNTVLGTIMLLFGFGFYGAAAYVYLTPPTPTGDAPLIEGDVKSCTVTMQQLGHTVEREGDELRVSRMSPEFDNAERLLADASLGISACGLPLIRFCMGPGCPVQGVSFALSAKVAAARSKPGAPSPAVAALPAKPGGAAGVKPAAR